MYDAPRFPLYMQIALTIDKEIRSKKFAVGSLLPTEFKLSSRYGVSRCTIREAIRHLRDQGKVSARQGVGTRVEAIGHPLAETTAVAELTSRRKIQKKPRGRSGPPLTNEEAPLRQHPDWVHLQRLYLSSGDPDHSTLLDIYVEKAQGGTGTPIVHLRLAGTK